MNLYVAMLDPITGGEIGRTYFNLQHVLHLHWDSLVVDDQVAITRQESEGAMENDDDMAIEFDSSCRYGCSGSRDTNYVAWDYGQTLTYDTTYTSSVAGAGIAYMLADQHWIIDHEDFLEPASMDYHSGDLRCDRVIYRTDSGCVIDYFTPTMGHAGLGEVTNHVMAAQSLGHPGTPGGTPLHYDPSAANAEARRAEACGNFTPDPGETCDEYPFASTYEGGIGSSAASVPSEDNSAQGGKIGSFYRYQRILDGDPFWVDPSLS